MAVSDWEMDQHNPQTDTELNSLTGLYYNRFFYRKAEEYLKNVKPGTHSLVAVDIEHFRMFNKLYGRAAGDSLLTGIAEYLLKFIDTYGGITGYLGGDNYAVLMPYRTEWVKELKYGIIGVVKQWNNTVGFLPALGVYLIDDVSVPVETMYDRATIALSKVLGNYSKRICEYNSDMEDRLKEELELLVEIQEGLEKEEFVFFIQPQCNISTGKIVGGESLVRWKRNTGEMIPPGKFIPVLEKNGLIADLDRYVWKKVCQWLRSCLDRGYHPVPISINVSRIDIFSMDVAAYLKELMENCQLPASLLKIEITESAYAESNDKIIRTVKQLRESDFLVMMDDFGSGYSSLNMLKSVAVDVLKIDMRFLEMNEKEEEKGIGILQSVINMARQMQMPIIVEGVETKKQEDFLMKMGCRYTQGYYYYKPLPVESFEKLMSDDGNLDFEGFWYKQVEAFHVREFLDDNLFNDIMVNNIIGAAAFYDVYENQIEITRVNEQYYQLAGISSKSEAEDRKCFWNHVRDDDRQLLYTIFEQAYENPVGGAQGYVHYLRADGIVRWIYLRVFFLREKEGHKQFYSSLTDMTSFKEKKEHLPKKTDGGLTEKQLEYMEKYYDDMPCGYGIVRVQLDGDGKPSDYEIVYANHEMGRICGGEVKQLRYMLLKAFGDKTYELLKKAYQAAYQGETVEYYAHSALTGSYMQFTLYQYEYGYAGCILRDITHIHIYEDALKNIMLGYREVYFIHLKDNYFRMVYPDMNHLLERGSYEGAINRHFETGKIRRYDEENIRRFLSLKNLQETLLEQDVMEYRYRRSVNGGGEEWCLVSIRVAERVNGVPKTAIMTIQSIEALMREKEENRRQNIAHALTNMSEGFFIYRAAKGEQILYANPMACKIFGCSTLEEFRELVGNSFCGMVHPEDLKRVEWEIQEQIRNSSRNMDFILYRIIRRDGEIRWIDDCGHLENSGNGEDEKLFYVFISDVTDTITEQQKEKLLKLNECPFGVHTGN